MFGCISVIFLVVVVICLGIEFKKLHDEIFKQQY